MNWIEPLEMETWIINVFSGTPEIFGAIAIIAISAMAGFFRMSLLSMFIMIGIFLLMFSGFIAPSIVVFGGIIGGLAVGWAVSLIIKR